MNKTNDGIVKVIVKENNAGGINYEAYDANDHIIAIIANVDDQANHRDDAESLIDGLWHYIDATDWYDVTGNNTGDQKMTIDDCGNDIDDGVLTAMDVIDNHPSTRILMVVAKRG